MDFCHGLLGHVMTEPLSVRILGLADASDLTVLRREALENAPLAFGSSPDDDRFNSPEVVRGYLDAGDDSVIFGLFCGRMLVGMLGLSRNIGKKELHKAHIWGLYVRPETRRLGAATQLMDAAITRTRRWAGVRQIQLSVTESAEAARGLYEKIGFVEWGCEPLALQWQGEYVNERHLALELRRD